MMTMQLTELQDTGTKASPINSLAPPPRHSLLPLSADVARRQLLIERRPLVTNLLLLGLLLLAATISLCLGTVKLSPEEVLQALLGQGDAITQFVVHQLRLQRVLAGLLTGGAFALAGCLMQTLARNRLATPGIIGIDNGATAFAVASVVGAGLSLAPSAMALAGAATAAALAFGLTGGGGTRGYRFIVAGIGIGAVFAAATQLMLTQVDMDSANAAYPWTVGTLNARPTATLVILATGLAGALILALGMARSLTIMQFSDQVALSLGIRLRQARYLALATSVALTGLAVAVAGPVGLVALLGPEIARALAGYRGVPLVGSVLAGALVMALADLAGRMIFAPLELPVGIVTAVIGGPYLLWILLRRSPGSHL